MRAASIGCGTSRRARAEPSLAARRAPDLARGGTAYTRGVNRQLDLAGLEILGAAILLVAGTIVFCVSLALAARVVDRLWDRLAPGDDEREQEARRATASTRVRRPPTAGVPRSILVTILVAAMLSALGWLAFVATRARELA